MADLRNTAVNPMTGRTGVPQMTETPRSARMGLLADALMSVRDFANRLQIPQGVPLLGGEGVGSLLLGRAPEELVEMSYGNMPMRINPYAGQTASFVPEMRPGRGAQVADLLSLAGIPGGGRTAAAAMGGAAADLGGIERALIGYHGTPHRFERFDASKIGTGEGAQAYGHGLYFAESPGVAKSYQTGLTSGGYSVTKIDGIPQVGDPDFGDALVLGAGEKPQKTLTGKEAFDYLKNYIGKPENDQDELALKWLDRYEREGRSIEVPGMDVTGSFYTVDIPDEIIGKMLDWNKPLKEQSENIRNAIYGIASGKYLTFSGGDRRFVPPPDANMSGGAAYERITQLLGKGEAKTSEALRAAGIPGIRYLDKGSRAAGEGTRNIVVFPGEEQNVKILSRE